MRHLAAIVAASIVIAACATPAIAQHGFGGMHMGGMGGGMAGLGGGMAGGMPGYGGAGTMMHGLNPAMSMGGYAGMHPYGFNGAGMQPYGYNGMPMNTTPMNLAPAHPYSPYGPTPVVQPHATGYNPWGPLGPANNHPLYPNHPLTPLYPPNHPLTPIQPVHPWYPNNYGWPWWWYNYPSYGYTYNMAAPYPYPYSNFWEMLGFYGHYGYYGANQGMVVTGVHQNTLANQIGLVQGDIVTAVNNTPVKNADQFVEALRQAQGTVTLTVYDTRTHRTSQLSFDPADAARYAPPNAGSQPPQAGDTPNASVTDESLGTQEDVRKVDGNNN